MVKGYLSQLVSVIKEYQVQLSKGGTLRVESEKIKQQASRDQIKMTQDSFGLCIGALSGVKNAPMHFYHQRFTILYKIMGIKMRLQHY